MRYCISEKSYCFKNDALFRETLLKLLISKKHFEHFCPCMRCAILLKSKMTCDQLEKAASFLNTSGHDISDVFEPASDPLIDLFYKSLKKQTLLIF